MTELLAVQNMTESAVRVRCLELAVNACIMDPAETVEAAKVFYNFIYPDSETSD